MFILAHVVDLEGTLDFRWRFAALVVGAFLLIAYWQEWLPSPFEWDLAIGLTFIFGYRTFNKAFQDLASRKVSADQAVAVAALAALYVGEYLAAAEVVYIMMVGETLEEYTGRRFQSDLKRLLSCIPHHAHVLRSGTEVEIHVEEIQPGESVIVYPGQRIPVDGKILEGESLVDESSITGESVPRERLPGETVYAGTLNSSSRLLLEASQVGESTVLSRIVDLVHHARENKAPIQRAADRYARWFLPLVIGIAAVCYLMTGDAMRSVAILIVACPCAMVLATPAAVMAAVSFLARRGVVVKGGVQLEKLARVDCLAFDKTGTVTRGRPELIDIVSFNGLEKREVLAWAASLESYSEHILAKAIRECAEKDRVPLYTAQSVQRHAGLGMEGTVEVVNRHIVVGSARFFQQQGFSLPESARQTLDRFASEGSIPVLVGEDGQGPKELAGILVFRDMPRAEAPRVLHELRHLGINKTVLLTGDNEHTARQITRMLGISEVHANLLPEEKLNRLEEIQRQGYTVAMVGDGVNDSPSLATADVGVAMGDTGTDIAAEAAGVVLMGEKALDRLPELIRSSRRTLKVIQDNIFWFGLVINLAAVLAAFAGYLSAVAAAVLHQVSSFLVLMSSLRLLRDWSSWDVSHRFHHWRAEQEARWKELRRRILGTQSISESLLAHKRRIAVVFLAAASVLYVASGILIVSPQEKALVARFGRVLEGEIESGLHYRLPWPLEQVYRLEPQRINALEIGFRTTPEALSQLEPAAYEWNIQHREGRYMREPGEAQMLTGDEYLLEVNAVVQYSISNAKDYFFQVVDVQEVLRAITEGALRRSLATHTLDDVLATGRVEVQQDVSEQLRQSAASLNLGLRIHSVNLQDVHPALEVVGAFREVASAMEEKSRRINEAQGYANERLPLARGESAERVIDAEAYQVTRTQRATGEAERFSLHERTYRQWPQTTSTRLYLQAVEEVLAGKTKYIIDGSSGRRKIMLFEDAIFPAGDLNQIQQPRLQSRDEGAVLEADNPSNE